MFRWSILNSTATSQKPLAVIEAMDRYYRRSNANIHRGVHTLAEEATAMYEQARVKIAKFINAPSAHQIIYTRNTTESINLVAYSWARANLKVRRPCYPDRDGASLQSRSVAYASGRARHRAGFHPCNRRWACSIWMRTRSLLSRSPKLVSFTHMSNVLGTINPAAEIIRLAHEAGAITLVDGGSIRSASESGCAGPRRGFPGLLCAQNVRTDRHRRVVWKDGIT